jgi:hypothetical protein
MPDEIQFVPPPPVPVAVPLPGLDNGRILAVKDEVSYRVLLAVNRASVLNGDITFYGDSLFFVIGDQTVTWKKYIGALTAMPEVRTFGQLARVPDPPYLRQIRMQPYPEFADDPFMEVKGLLVVGGDWDPWNQYTIIFRGDWCPLFRKQF